MSRVRMLRDKELEAYGDIIDPSKNASVSCRIPNASWRTSRNCWKATTPSARR